MQQQPELAQQFPGATVASSTSGLDFAADSFGTTLWVAFGLVVLTFVPVAFLPRKRLETPAAPTSDAEPAAVPVSLH